MEISKIKSVFELTQKLTNKKSVLIPLLAKKLRVSDVELMDFIENNPKLFFTEPLYSYKKVIRKSYLWPNSKETYKWPDYEKNKNLGLGITTIYLKPADNWRTEEWLEERIEKDAKYIHITESDNYSYIQGYYIEEDKPDEYRRHLWRNTPNKILFLQENGYTEKGSFVYGGFGDSYSSNYKNIISLENINKLRRLGWTFNEFKPLSN